MKQRKQLKKPIINKQRTLSKNPNKSLEYSNMLSFFFKVVVPIIVIVIASYFSYVGYMQTRVNTPFSNEKLVQINKINQDDNLWGSYRSNIYFGMKTRKPHSLVTGLMWYFPKLIQADGNGLRHWCSQNDNLQKYGWIKHDGKNFGIQEIIDNDVLIKTSFVKNFHGSNGGDWTAKIHVSKLKKTPFNNKISLIFYTAIEDRTADSDDIYPIIENEALVGIDGLSKNLGFFKISFDVLNNSKAEQSFLVTTAPNLSLLKETVLHNLKVVANEGNTGESIILQGENVVTTKSGKRLKPTFMATQITSELPLEFEVSFESENMENKNTKLVGKYYDQRLTYFEKLFDEKFENRFQLTAKKYSKDEISFAKAAFSNLLGSVGYFYGSAQVKSIYTQGPVPYWPAELYSGVPSRSFFPRGFLWDEGFHGLLISIWDLDIEIDIISHWFDLMNVEGWIPREMILGEEALAKVPEEFVTQTNTNANPPTFFLTLQFLLKHKRTELLSKYMPFLEKVYPRLQKWFNWYNVTQKGIIASTYRWQGRDEKTVKELNPKTLTSGLDDYPRASHPDLNERHIDLRCWIALASFVMADIAQILNKPNNRYIDTFKYLSDNTLLNSLHWSNNAQMYADYGLHTDNLRLQRPIQSARSAAVQQDKIRFVSDKPEYKFIDSSFGYVSLFPFLLHLVDSNSIQLGKILEDLEKSNLLWTDYGLRSLAKDSPYYMKYNTEHDPPYWRGPIWMNLNYLTVAALNHYSKINGPHRIQAENIYNKLRKNLINNVVRQYKKSGYIWENYADDSGIGKGSHPFTGWTSLVVLLMAEIY